MTTNPEVFLIARNEERSIRRTIEGIFAQDFSAVTGRELEVTIVTGGCSDQTVRVARQAAASPPSAVHIDVVELSRPDRASALNYSLDRCSGPYIILTHADVTYSNNAFRCVVDLLEGDSDVLVAGPENVDEVMSTLRGSRLAEYYRIRELHRNFSGPPRMPTERLIGFKVDLIESFPQSVAASDDYVCLLAASKAGWTSVSVSTDSFVRHRPPQNWADLLATRTRNVGLTADILARFPELRSAVLQGGDGLRPRQLLGSVDDLVREAALSEGIDEESIEVYRLLDLVAEDNRDLCPGIISETGQWAQIATTKL